MTKKLTEHKIVSVLFSITFFVMLFNNAPKLVQANSFGGPFAGNLLVYPLIALLVYTLYCRFYKKETFEVPQYGKRFIGVYSAVLVIALIHGFVTYPYYDMVFQTSVDQSDKMKLIYQWLSQHNIPIKQDSMIVFWMVLRFVKNTILDVVYCWGIVFLTYAWFKNRDSELFLNYRKSILIGFYIFLVIGIIDSIHLAKFDWATQLLLIINPFFHPVATDMGWWPRVMLDNQLRSFFSEPSFVGNYAAFLMPLIIYQFSQGKHKLIYSLIFALFVFMIFLTQARTAVAIIVVYVALMVLLALYTRKWKSLLVIIPSVVIMFFVSVLFISHLVERADGDYNVTSHYVMNDSVTAHDNALKHESNATAKSDVSSYKSYAAHTVGSLDKGKERSNGARYAVMKSSIRVGLAHPIIGVGPGLGTLYLVNNFTSTEAHDYELSNWIKTTETEGILKNAITSLTEYLTRFAETGFVGLGVFLAPFFYVLVRLLIRMRQRNNERIHYQLFLVASLVCGLVTGFNGGFSTFPAIWFILGMGLLEIDSKQQNQIS